MTVEQTNIVDFVSVSATKNEVVLTISDHLEWDEKKEHLFLLQEKLNRYLAFIESDELLRSYPSAIGKSVVVDVVCMHPLNAAASDFFERGASIFSDAGFRLTYQILSV
jgi:hypothetical protein